MNGASKLQCGIKQKCKAALTAPCSRMNVGAGVLIAAFPILAPYTAGGIYLTWLLGALFVIWNLLERVRFSNLRSLRSAVMPLICYTLVSFLLSINGFFILNNSEQLRNAEIALIVDIIIYIMLWYHSDIAVTMKCANLFGYICCAYAVFQMLMSVMGNTVPLGHLPLLGISGTWVSDVWGFRFNSLFSEPSYFAIYLLPIFLYNFSTRRWINAAVFGISVLLSSSSLGIILLLIVAVLQFISFGWKKKYEKRTVALFLLVFCGLMLILLLVPPFNKFSKRSFEKIGEIFESFLNGTAKDDIRLFGYSHMFKDLPLKEKFFGVGNAQLQNYFAERGVSVYNYSNSFVLSLLNYGVIGLAAFMAFLGNTFYRSCQNRTVLFWLILALVCAVDSALFSARYYWLLYFVMFTTEKRRLVK